jgi:NDP-sugar pyrophosphorylase family protein
MVSDAMHALILAGGKGTRLRPYTTVVPKPLMPVGEMPVIEIMLLQLRRAGVREVIIACGHMGHLLQAFLQDGGRLGMKIEYSFETEALGTAGPIALAIDRLPEHFMVLNGDLLTTLDYRRLFEAHVQSGAAATLGLCSREVHIDFGVIEVGEGDRLGRYIEKPTYRFDVAMGANVFTATRIRPFLRAGQPLDIPELMTSLCAAGEEVRCHRAACYWLDIGRLDDFQTANEIFAARRAEFLPPDGPAPG